MANWVSSGMNGWAGIAIDVQSSSSVRPETVCDARTFAPGLSPASRIWTTRHRYCVSQATGSSTAVSRPAIPDLTT